MKKSKQSSFYGQFQIIAIDKASIIYYSKIVKSPLKLNWILKILKLIKIYKNTYVLNLEIC